MILSVIRFLLVCIFCTALFGTEFDDFLKEHQSEYESHVSAEDKAFSGYLKKDWKSFQSSYANTPYLTPKPKELPVLLEKTLSPKLIKQSQKPTLKPVKKPISAPTKKMQAPILAQNEIKVVFDFYSHHIQININKQWQEARLGLVSNQNISKLWEKYSAIDYQGLLGQIERHTKTFGLNDWANYQLIHRLGQEMYSTNNDATLFAWFVLNKMNYLAQVGYEKRGNDIYLLLALSHQIYQVPYIPLGEQNYYMINVPKSKAKVRVLTYANPYSSKQNALSFYIGSEFRLAEDYRIKKLFFSYGDKKYLVHTKYAKNIIDFYRSYPQSDYVIYLRSQGAYSALAPLQNDLKAILKNKTELESVDMILRFVQKAFEYKTDEDQFGYEKVFFPEETLFYSHSDCEDRSLLFAHLVQNLLGLDVILLKYKNHLSTAVALQSATDGDSLKHNGKRYTIADPTYVNAPLGKAMPKHKNSQFTIIQ